MALQIDVYYIKNCADYEEYARLVEAALAELGLEGEWNYYLVDSDRKANEWGFIGSPTIRVNGEDLIPAPGAASGMRLRSYFTSEGMFGTPSYEMIVDALQQYL